MNPPAIEDCLIMKEITTLLNCYERSLQLLFPIVIHQQTNYFAGVNKYCCVSIRECYNCLFLLL